MNKQTINQSLYKVLCETIRREIQTGKYKVHQQLPSENELCNIYGVSRTTVRKGLDNLESDNWIYREHGKGTFVADRMSSTINQSLQNVSSFNDTIMKKGYNAGTRIIDFKTVVADMILAKFLNVDAGENVIKMLLVGTADDKPVVIYESYFKIDLGLKLHQKAKEKIEAGIPFSTLDLYEEIPDCTPQYMDQTFESIGSSDPITQHLKINNGEPLLLVTSVLYSDTSEPVEYRKAYYLADKYRFYIRRQLG